MAVNLSIKGVPDTLAARLRERAARNHRSLQGELMALIERAVTEPDPGDASARDVAQRMPASRDNHGVRRGSKTIEQIAAEHRILFPKPITGGPLAVDIIRTDRDSR